MPNKYLIHESSFIYSRLCHRSKRCHALVAQSVHHRKFIFQCEKAIRLFVNFALLCESLPFTVLGTSNRLPDVHFIATCRLAIAEDRTFLFLFDFVLLIFSVFGTLLSE